MRSELSKRKKTPRNLFLKKFPRPTNRQVILSSRIIKKARSEKRNGSPVGVQKGWIGPKKYVEGRNRVDIQERRKTKQTESEITCGKPRTGN